MEQKRPQRSNWREIWRRNSDIKDPKELEEFLDSVQTRDMSWEILETILNNKAKARDAIPTDDPAWIVKTAAAQGYRQAIKDFLEIIPRPEVRE